MSPSFLTTSQPSDSESILPRTLASLSELSNVSSSSPRLRMRPMAWSGSESTRTSTSGRGSTARITLYAVPHRPSGR